MGNKLDQFNYVSSSSGAVQAASSTYPAATLNTVAPGAPINITKNGYLYVWVSNETQGWDVFFDNLSVQYKQGPLLEENHYYPFGLSMQGISDKAMKTNYAENKYRYNAGTELQNKEFSDGTGLEMYETSFRGLDPQLGRFTQIDPMADKYNYMSTYQYAGNNPVLFIDPSGGFRQTNITVNPFSGGVDETNSMTASMGGGGVMADAAADAANSIISQCGDGFTQFVVNPDGTLTQTLYDATPIVTTLGDQTGVTFNYLTQQNDGLPSQYNPSTDARAGGQMNTMDYTQVFVSMSTLSSDWEQYNTADWWDYTKTGLAMFGGILETGVGVLTSEVGIGEFLMADGVSRTMLNGSKIYTLATQGRVTANADPTNLLGAVGNSVDNAINPNMAPGQIGTWQNALGTANDAATMLFAPEETTVPNGIIKSTDQYLNNPVYGANSIIKYFHL